MDNLEKVKQELGEKISKCNRIILGLQSHDPFIEMLTDFKDQMKRLDDGWQWITEDKLLKEAQITKMATLSIVNCLDTYRYDMEQAEKQLTEITNQDKIVSKDFDNEGVDNAEEDRKKVKKTGTKRRSKR